MPRNRLRPSVLEATIKARPALISWSQRDAIEKLEPRKRYCPSDFVTPLASEHPGASTCPSRAALSSLRTHAFTQKSPISRRADPRGILPYGNDHITEHSWTAALNRAAFFCFQGSSNPPFPPTFLTLRSQASGSWSTLRVLQRDRNTMVRSRKLLGRCSGAKIRARPVRHSAPAPKGAVAYP